MVEETKDIDNRRNQLDLGISVFPHMNASVFEDEVFYKSFSFAQNLLVQLYSSFN